MSSDFNQQMHKDVSRKEFLLTLGLSIASIAGFARIIELLTGQALEHHLVPPSPSGGDRQGYGL